MLAIDEKYLTATQIANFDGCTRRKLQNSFQIRFNSCEFCELMLTKPVIACSKLNKETLQQGVK